MYGYIPQADVDLFVVLRSRISLREIKQNQKRQANKTLAKAREYGRELAYRELAEMFGASRQFAYTS